MTSSDLILHWLDGSLSSDAEAELLHLLSVSPERREVLHSYLQQKQLVARDMASISVPYAAEAALWQRLGTVMPAQPGASSPSAPLPVLQSEAPVGAAVSSSTSSTGILSELRAPVIASIAAIALVLGLGVGYVMGDRVGASRSVRSQAAQELATAPTAAESSVQHMTPSRQNARSTAGSHSVALQHLSPASLSISDRLNRIVGDELNRIVGDRFEPIRSLSSEALARLFIEHVAGTSSGLKEPAVEPADVASGPPIDEIELHPNISLAAMRNIGGDKAVNPLHIRNDFETQQEQTLLQRFEFSILESFGREFPNSTATNVSMPIVTNTALGVFFQVLPHSNALWVGASGGTANLTRKHFVTQAGDPVDPLQQQLTSELGHVQTNWAGGFVQLRLPFIAKSDLTFTGGYGLSGAGRMAIGELGLHIDASRDVGFQLGVRGIELNYDLSGEKEAALKSARGSVVVVRGAADSQPSYNLELSTGLFFHF